MTVREITDGGEKQRIARAVLEDLTDWFGVAESREKYIRESAGQTLLAAFDGDEPAGFVCLKRTGNATAELAVLGVKRKYHRQGAGRALCLKAMELAAREGFSFLQVKTVKMGVYEDYDATNRFYLSLGFKEFEVFPLLWDERNPCQVYVMSLK
ncbi:MAG: GNAT family N-acetyltransferase [Clostridia bacterium]|nr:GNAT family N-acetyltransferase [Clostridia bacterium]